MTEAQINNQKILDGLEFPAVITFVDGQKMIALGLSKDHEYGFIGIRTDPENDLVIGDYKLVAVRDWKKIPKKISIPTIRSFGNLGAFISFIEAGCPTDEEMIENQNCLGLVFEEEKSEQQSSPEWVKEMLKEAMG